MVAFRKDEARDWARENLHGVANVVIPSYTLDLKGLNETGIRHDIRREIELGFTGALMVSEVALTLDEYEQFYEWASDEANGRLQLIFHAAFNTLEENIEAAKIAERHGAELTLLGYPANFYAETGDDILEYTKAFCEATEMGVMLFPTGLWGFGRVHVADIETAVIRRILDACPNVVAIKAEGGRPTIMSVVECSRLFGDEVVISCPIEGELIPLAQVLPIQYSATSNTEYYGDTIPRAFDLLQRGEFEEATRIYWQIHPARRANAAASAYIQQTHFINRMLWKYQGWLNGFNGGPVRQPTLKIHDGQMNALRNALVESGMEPDRAANREFFIGRNPVETAPRAVAISG
jgi:4-hydroxy-tetrahydrodipicolinate synthase